MTDISSTRPLPLSKIKRPEDWINLQRIITPQQAPQAGESSGTASVPPVAENEQTAVAASTNQRESLHDIVA